MKKGEIYEGVVTRTEYQNRGIVSLPDGLVTVKNTIPGQRIRFRIHKKRSGRAEGILLEVLEPSPLEKNREVCSIFPACGGCQYLSMEYDEQLRMKDRQIRQLLDPLIRDDDGEIWEEIIPSPEHYGYRNKMEFSFGDEYKGGPLALGLHKKASTYDVLNVSDCRLIHQDLNRIAEAVAGFFREKGTAYYHRMTHEGVLRHLMLRRAASTGQILVSLVTVSQGCPDLEPLVRILLDLTLEGRITGILHIVNDSVADVVRADRIITLFGEEEYYEELLGLRFRITPFSFFQPNTGAAEKLYLKIRSYAAMCGDLSGKTVFDLYCGTGTIAQVLAPLAKQVIGVEIVPEAVEAARENAERNGLDNCRFICGDVLKCLDELSGKPDLIILDPPRDGIHPKALPRLLACQVPNIIYVSCKATSLARDLPAFFAQGYSVRKICCVDQFCHTCHVETVVLMTRNT